MSLAVSVSLSPGGPSEMRTPFPPNHPAQIHLQAASNAALAANAAIDASMAGYLSLCAGDVGPGCFSRITGHLIPRITALSADALAAKSCSLEAASETIKTHSFMEKELLLGLIKSQGFGDEVSDPLKLAYSKLFDAAVLLPA